MAVGKTNCALVLHDRGKRLRIERSSAHQRPINLLLRHERRHVLWLDRATVENPQLAGEGFTENLGGFLADDGMRFGRNFRSRGLSGADRPHRLIGDDQFGRLLRRDGVNGADRKSTRLNSSHMSISYAVFCLKKKT